MGSRRVSTARLVARSATLDADAHRASSGTPGPLALVATLTTAVGLGLGLAGGAQAAFPYDPDRDREGFQVPAGADKAPNDLRGAILGLPALDRECAKARRRLRGNEVEQILHLHHSMVEVSVNA